MLAEGAAKFAVTGLSKLNPEDEALPKAGKRQLGPQSDPASREPALLQQHCWT